MLTFPNNNRPGEVRLDDFLALLRIPMRAFKENIRTIDIVHTEHKNADPGPGEKIFNFTGQPLINLAGWDPMI